MDLMKSLLRLPFIKGENGRRILQRGKQEKEFEKGEDRKNDFIKGEYEKNFTKGKCSSPLYKRGDGGDFKKFPF